MFASLSYSQYNKSIDISAGIADGGYGAEIAYNHYTYRRDYFQTFAIVNYNQQIYKQYEIPYLFGGIGFGYYTPISFDRRERFFISIGGGGLIGYEQINEGEKELPNGALINSDENLIYGLFAGIELENRITQGVNLLIKGKQQYHFNSDLGNFSTYIGVGTRLDIN